MAQDNGRRPNILVITDDQHNPTCFGYAGHPVVRTPNIDALVASGTNFSRAYVAHPLCTPSRASLFTGLTTRGHRVRMNGIQLRTDVPTWPEALSQQGYTTHYSGKPHLRISRASKGTPIDQVDPNEFSESRELWHSGRIRKLPTPYYGFQTVDFVNGHGHGSWGQYVNWLNEEHPKEADLFHNATPLEPPSPASKYYSSSYKWALPEELHPISWITDRAIDFLNGEGRINLQVEDGPQEPFVLWTSYQDPHVPLAPPAPWCYKYDPADSPPPIWREGELDDLPPHIGDFYNNKGKQIMPYHAECAAHYYGLIEMIDHNIGRIMQALRDNGLEENTVVLFTTDHGEALGDHGMWGKGPYHYDSVIRAPFFIRWPARFPQGQTHEGVVSLLDFAPTILDIAGVPIPEGPKPPISVSDHEPEPWPGRSLVPILTGEEKGTTGSALVEDDQDGLGFRVRTLVTQRYRLTAYSGQPYGELFDLQKDPQEVWNLWDNPDYRSIRDDLRLEMLDKIMSTDYPLPRRMGGS